LPPISYSIGGKQYVTVLTGSGATGGGILSSGIEKYRTDYHLPHRVLTFVLDGKDHLPPVDLPPLKAVDDPDFHPDLEREQKGAVAFGMTGCLVCHGWNAVGGGSAPDLRGSPYIVSRDAFRAVVVDGTLVTAGMPAFPELPDDQIDAIRQYLRKRSQQLNEQPAAAAGKNPSKGPSQNATFAGTWEVVVDSPVGKQPATGVFKVDGNKIAGRQSSSQGGVDLEGTVDGEHATWSGKAYIPFPVTLKFDVTLDDDDSFSGTLTSAFGTFPVTGTRH
jgi:quinohemoprotein ethanol dehydrogenase